MLTERLPVPVSVITVPSAIVIAPSALKVKLASELPVITRLALILILPASAPPALAVSTVTLVPEFKAAKMVAALIVEPAPVGLKFGPALILLLPVAIVIL